MKNVIILGAGGAGWDIVSLIKAINSSTPQWNILGFLDDNPMLHGKVLCGIEVLGSIDTAKDYKNTFFVSSIANPTNRLVRRQIWDRVKSQGGQFATLIHPSVILYENVQIGEGVVINANCVIGTCAQIEDDVHFGYSCNIAHEVLVEHHTSFGTGVNISSGVKIGSDCYIGAGVTTTHDVEIECDSLIAIGSAVGRNLKNGKHEMWIGVPAINGRLYSSIMYKLKKLIKS